MMKVKGIHHISAISGHAQENVDFYSSFLSLKMAVKTLNFDQYNIYHLYYTNGNYDLGSGLTYFPWKSHYKQGEVGAGQVTTVIVSIPKGSMNFWMNRLNKFMIPYDLLKRFGETRIHFRDQHGLAIELVESDLKVENIYTFNGVEKESAITGIYGALLSSNDFEKTSEFLEDVLGLEKLVEDSVYIRYQGSNEIGKYIELSKLTLPQGISGKGTYHHIAFEVSEPLEVWHQYLTSKGIEVTEIKDRHFFKSIYMREPGGIMIELAATGPGFEKSDTNNPELYIPEQFKQYEAQVKSELFPLFIREVDRLQNYTYQNLEEFNTFDSHQKLLSEINRLARKSKSEGLTEEETIYRNELRRKYVESITGMIVQNLENVKVEDENKEFQQLKRKKVSQKE
ncbi:VOC family protein [Acholeplasma equirhinis]|uniref:VOC family protein n=1 Tax=Acholeplasma equirhinis TaxID=555393 RepID=UPI00197AFB62|nr:VOC family protein [Acholeplasma equirhinis]MBN3490308.1 VOC family protein [Acholeplasma equirhinis]